MTKFVIMLVFYHCIPEDGQLYVPQCSPGTAWRKKPFTLFDTLIRCLSSFGWASLFYFLGLKHRNMHLCAFLENAHLVSKYK